MKITVKNFRGLRSAELSGGPIFLISGINSAGKSSLANAVAACLTGRAIEDSFELRKSDIKDLIRDGSTAATVEIVTDKGAARMTYPDAKLSTTGDAPRASVFAVGLSSIPTMPLKERAAALAGYMKADPTIDDLRRVLIEEFDEETIGRCWEVIKRDGWDATLKNLEDKRAKARATWEQITSENFGSAKAKQWHPEGWSGDLFRDVTYEELESLVERARRSVESAVGAAAVNASDLDKLRTVAGEADVRLLAVDEAKTAAEAIKREKEALEQRALAAPLPDDGHAMFCPHCNGKIRLKNTKPGVLVIEKVEAPAVSADENQRRRNLKAELDGALSNAANRLGAAQRAVTVAEERYAEAQRAQEKVAAAGTGNESAAADAEGARSRLREAETNLARFTRKQDADAAFDRWELNDRFCTVLSAGPNGLRAKKLAETTLKFNSDVLLPLCNTAGWGKVEITEDFRVTLNGRVFPLLSDSDQMRVRIVLQVAMAKIDQSSMIVIDRAEALDAENKKKLFTLLIECKIPALVAMVVPKPSMVPDLEKAGVGSTLWIENNEAKPLRDVA